MTYQVAENIKTIQSLNIKRIYNRDSFDYRTLKTSSKPLLTKVDSQSGLKFKHEENRYVDFKGQSLIPYQISDRGPAVAVGNLNNDGLENVFFGSSKYEDAKLFVQNQNVFKEEKPEILKTLNKPENIYASISDINNDGITDLLIGNAGGEFYGSAKALTDQIISQQDSSFSELELPENYLHTSVILKDDSPCPDLFGFGHAVSNDFGRLPDAYFFKNECNQFTNVENDMLKNYGMVTDAIGFGINGDGQQEIILGNFGNNSKFKAKAENPLRLYYAGFDSNGQPESIVCVLKTVNIIL